MGFRQKIGTLFAPRENLMFVKNIYFNRKDIYFNRMKHGFRC